MSQPDPIQLLAAALGVADTFGLEGASLQLSGGPPSLGVWVAFRDCTVRRGDLDGVLLESGAVRIRDLDVPALLDQLRPPGEGARPDPQKLLGLLDVRVEHLRVRIHVGLLNRAIELGSSLGKIPSAVQELQLSFAGDRLNLKGKVSKGLTVPFSVDLRFRAVENRLVVVFDGFWMANTVPLPGWARKLLLSIGKSQIPADLKDVVTMTEDRIVINPWPRVPIELGCEFTRFDIEGSFLVIELQGKPEAPARPAPITTPAEAPAPAENVAT